MLNYLDDNRDSLWYGRRLAEGLPIGGGLIEGGGKNTLARRLKINSARWRVCRAERMGAIALGVRDAIGIIEYRSPTNEGGVNRKRSSAYFGTEQHSAY